MLKQKLLIFILLANLWGVFAQSADPVILSYQRNFIRASMSTKLELLNDASRITTVVMTPLYIDALAFVHLYYPVMGTDTQLIDLAVIATVKSAGYTDASVLPVLRTVFTDIPETRLRVACLNTFAVLAKGQKDYISFLNNWFTDSLSASLSGTPTDVKTLTACAVALGRIADASSFQSLFKGATSSLDSSIVGASGTALNAISDSYTDNILAIIAQKHLKEAYTAFSFAMKKDSLPAAEKGRIAEASFAFGIEVLPSVTENNSVVLPALIRESMEQLTALKWSQASPLVVKYFYQKQSDYKNEKANVEVLVPVIQCMGAMGTTDAAQALSIFLGLLNSDTEQKKTYNEQLMLAVIQAVGDLGDKSAFDYLLYVGYLDYPETVKKASRDALARLQW